MTTLAAAPARLCVESGAQCGADVVISDGPRTVGGDVGDDIVLFDPALSRAHFSLARELRGVRLRALSGPICLQNGLELFPGDATLCFSTTWFRAGNSCFRLDVPDTPSASPPRPGRAPPRAALTGVASLVLCAALIGAAALLGATPVAEAGRAPAGTATTASPSHPAFSTEHALAAMRMRLAATGIEAVQLTAGLDGSIEARGQLSASQRPMWQDVGRWFDAAYGGLTVLVDQVHVASETPPLAVRAVWPGPSPYVVDGSGEKLFVGAALSGGWVIESITADRVLVRRGAQAYAVRF